MAESNEPEHPHTDQPGDPAEPVHSEPTEPDNGPEGEWEGEEPVHPDIRTGFSFEQRRFLWTLAGLNVVAVLLGAAIIVGYMAEARSQDTAVVQLEDKAKTADATFRRTAENNMPGMIRAAMAGDKVAVAELKQEVFDSYKGYLDLAVAVRRARGLPAVEPTPEELDNFMNNYEAQFDQSLALNEQAATQRAAATRAAAATPAASRPAAKPK